MSVFLLNVSIIPVQRWTDITVAGSRDFSDVYLTIDEAVDAGKKLMVIWLESISEVNRDIPIQYLVGNWCLAEFKVYEFDPDVTRDENGLWEEYAEWKYNYKGELLDRNEFKSLTDGLLMGYCRRPGDEDENAGSRFKPGDFVKLIGKYKESRSQNEIIYSLHQEFGEMSIGEVLKAGIRSDEETVYVVRRVPGKGNPGNEYHENIYTVDFINKDMEFDHYHPHEEEIQLFDGEVPKGHPLHLIRKNVLGEVNFSDEMWEDIFYGRIIFDHPDEVRSWKEMDFSHEKSQTGH